MLFVLFWRKKVIKRGRGQNSETYSEDSHQEEKEKGKKRNMDCKK